MSLSSDISHLPVTSATRPESPATASTHALAGSTRAARRWRFRPTLWSTLLLAALLPVFLSLADWQWQKAERKSGMQNQLDSRSRDALVSPPETLVSDPQSLRYRHMQLRGEFVAAAQILLDNQVNHGRPGLHVLTPLRLENSRWHVLVDRGWIPAAIDRRHMPEPAVPEGIVEIAGIVALPPNKIFRLGPETARAGYNEAWQHLDLARYGKLSRLNLQPFYLQLDPDASHGFVRDWPRPDERHAKNRSYALQWLGFALASIAIWGWFAFRTDTPATGAPTANGKQSA